MNTEMTVIIIERNIVRQRWMNTYTATTVQPDKTVERHSMSCEETRRMMTAHKFRKFANGWVAEVVGK